MPLVRAISVAWHVTPGIAKWSKRRRHSLLQSVGAPRGRPVPRGGRARFSRTTRSNSRGTIGAQSGGTHLGLRRPLHPSRGVAEQKTSAVGASRSRGTSARCGREMRKGLNRPFHAPRSYDRGVRGRFEEGLRIVERRANLRSGRSVHGARASSDACGSRGSLLASARKGRQRANVGEELRRPSSRSRIRRPAVGARASSYCRSR